MSTLQADQSPKGDPDRQMEQATSTKNGSGELDQVLTELHTALEARATALADLDLALKTKQIDLKAFKAELAAHQSELEEVIRNLEILLGQETEIADQTALTETLAAALEALKTTIVLTFHQETDPGRQAELEARHTALEMRRRELSTT